MTVRDELLLVLSVPRAILIVLMPLPSSVRVLLIIVAPASELESRGGIAGRARELFEKNSGEAGLSSTRGPLGKVDGSSV